MSDLIDRQAAIDALGKDPGFKVRLFGKSYDEGRSDQWFRDVYKLTTLPPEQPERKKGHWIRQSNRRKTLYGWYQCSECGAFCGGETNFCSECGADMREDEQG